MSTDFRELERTVEQEMGLLHALPAAAPRPERLARIQAAVVAEAGRLGLRRRTWRLAGVGTAAAAAILLMFGWRTFSRRAVETAAPDPEAVLAEWATALDESNDRLASLLEGDWTRVEPTANDDAEFDELLRGLDESFERFDTLESG